MQVPLKPAADTTVSLNFIKGIAGVQAKWALTRMVPAWKAAIRGDVLGMNPCARCGAPCGAAIGVFPAALARIR